MYSKVQLLQCISYHPCTFAQMGSCPLRAHLARRPRQRATTTGFTMALRSGGKRKTAPMKLMKFTRIAATKGVASRPVAWAGRTASIHHMGPTGRGLDAGRAQLRNIPPTLWQGASSRRWRACSTPFGVKGWSTWTRGEFTNWIGLEAVFHHAPSRVCQPFLLVPMPLI